LKFVVAPNPFKGSIGAPAAAAAMARGIREVFPAADVVEVPVADGGEGTVEAGCSMPAAAISNAVGRLLPNWSGSREALSRLNGARSRLKSLAT
jgi:hypothetical protein